MTTLPAPETNEYAPAFAGYVGRLARSEDVLAVLAGQLEELPELARRFGEARGDYRYADGKWSVKEVIGHLADSERIFAYRALRIARGDGTPLAGFDEEAYAPEMQAGARTLADFVGEWRDVRRATLSLFRGLPAAAWTRRGTANGQSMTTRAAAWVIAGHTRHHAAVLRERYTG
jgi:hypothetical protein